MVGLSGSSPQGSSKTGWRVVPKSGGESVKKILKETGIVVVDFYADWCGPCRIMSEALERVAEAYPEVRFLKVNVDDNPKWAEELNVKSVPTVLFYRNGRLVHRHVGAVFGSVEETAKVIADIIERLKSYESSESGTGYVYPRLLKRHCGKWFRIESEEDIFEQIEEFLEVFSKTAFEDPLIEPIDTPFKCPFCGDSLYDFFAELPTEYGPAYIRVEYCLNCKKAVVYRSRYVKLHFRRHGIIPVPEGQASLNIFLVEGVEAHAAESA